MTSTKSKVPTEAIAASAENALTWPTAFHDAGDGQAAEQEAGEIEGAHQPDVGGGKPFLRAAQRDQRALQPIAAEQDAGSEKEREQRADGGHEGAITCR
jgi:hypothetical protein